MNYRHAFHAGNFADVMKHVVLARIILHLRAKPAPFRVVDTHAGIGWYDLSGDEAARTGEWRDGIGRMGEPFEPAVETLLAPYRQALAATRSRHGPAAYPGSPALIREMIRPQDRAVLVELRPDDAATLRDRLNTVHNIKVIPLDGWIALRSLVPPRERRGLVLIDPPYEEPGELMRAALRLADASVRWPTGVFSLWYPVKQPGEIETFAARLGREIRRPCLRLELTVDEGHRDGKLAGSGLLVVNPPWTLAADAALMMPALAQRLGRLGGVPSWRIEPLG